MGSGISRTFTGAFTGTGADLDIRTVGFRPKRVEIINLVAPDKLLWLDKMADANGFKSVAAGANTIITSNGVTPLSDGFRIGADTDINVADQDCVFICHE